MDSRTLGRVAGPEEFPGVVLGAGVIIHGRVLIAHGARIGDYCVLGVPGVDDIEGCDGNAETRVGAEARTGSYCVIHRGTRIGRRVWLDDRCTIGPDSTIGNETRILYGAQIHWRVTIGERCVVAGFCCDRASIGDGCIMLGKLIHRLEDPRAPWDDVEEPSPRLESGSVVGFDALVIGGVTVHADAYVLAGATVTKDVPSGSVVVGTRHYSKQAWTEMKKRQRG